MKGKNAEEVGRVIYAKWHRFASPVAVGLDASRFDQHVSEDGLRWEHSVYNEIYNDTELRSLLTAQLCNDCTGVFDDGIIKYKVRGKRQSGDMNTSLGNVLLMTAMLHRYITEKALDSEVINNGDDSVVIMEERDLLRFQTGLTPWFVRYGFTMKVEAPVRILEHVEFCQARPVCVNGQYIMCRNPYIAPTKDTTCKRPDFHKGRDLGWLAGVGLCGMSISSGMPVMQEFYYKCLSTAKPRVVFGQNDTGLEWAAKGLKPGVYREVAPSTRISFWEAWGLCPDEQRIIEAKYRTAQLLFDAPVPEIDLFDHRPISRLLTRDY